MGSTAQIGAPFAAAEIGFEGAEVAREVGGGHLLRTLVSGTPAVAGLALADDLAAHNEDILHAFLKAGPLAHERGGWFVRHVPEIRDRLAVEAAIRAFLKLRHVRPRADTAALDRVPAPRAPRLVLALGTAVEALAGVVGLLDEAPGVADVDGVLWIARPREVGDGGALGAVDADLCSHRFQNQQVFGGLLGNRV